MAGRFEITTRSTGEFQFNLLAGNGQVILSSEGYAAKAACRNGIESVKKHSEHDEFFERLTDEDGRPYFNLKDANGQVIGHGQRYSSPTARNNGIESVMINAPSARVVDRTLVEG
ncbi:YegP family protein [Marilutibacter chinensis]|uniref:YegP family protein n=1 Tax=Marilutibacter chinensis TaxID=2912247 RepID=A0ABS9HVN0_9GAMM|nr:YegP family protein [Lysobacter chinensis]MCF7222566.1 YegP family protein [Lysobacter chinensis]